jgi:hypothetical protein
VAPLNCTGSAGPSSPYRAADVPLGSAYGNDPAVQSTSRYRLETVTSWQWGGRLRAFGRVSGTFAALAMIVVGCQVTTQGTAKVDASGAPIYRASVSSVIASASSSEFARQASLTRQAVKDSCDTLSHSVVDSIEAVNVFVRAVNGGTSDDSAKAGPAIDALNRGADLVLGTLSAPLSPELANALRAWADASRNVAGTISRAAGTAEFNAAIKQFNDAKKTALDLCVAAS